METITFENPRDVSVQVGDTLVFDLPYVGGTGYQWEWAENEVLEKLSEEYIAESDAPGGGGRIHYTLRAERPGKVDIEMFYWQPWSGKESIEKSFTIELTVK